MFRSMSLRNLACGWFALLMAGATFGAVAPDAISIGSNVAWFAAFVGSAMMVSLWRPEPSITLAANLAGKRQLRRRRRVNELIRAHVHRS
jgi:hypothetical protein